MHEANASIVGVWDTDVMLPDTQIDQAIEDIREGKAVMSFPYDGKFCFCSAIDSFLFRYKQDINDLKEKELKFVFFPYSVGGAFLVNKDVYLKAGGDIHRRQGDSRATWLLARARPLKRHWRNLRLTEG